MKQRTKIKDDLTFGKELYFLNKDRNNNIF